MAIEPRSNPLWKRSDQLTKWRLSEMAKESDRFHASEKVHFDRDCVFIACCAEANIKEVELLLDNGANIHATNTDGLTALHQACIDNNSAMVEFLINRGANVSAADNEGWTPLHATASQGYTEIARILIANGADIRAVNCDNELPFDLSESEEMDELLEEEMRKIDMNIENARNVEENLMIEDATQWMKQGKIEETVDPQTGATSLHVAASKGYTEVLRLLLKAGADVNAQDYDGWTPAHAAAHWDQKEALTVLVMEGLCDLEASNSYNQTPEDVCESKLAPYLEELKTRQKLKSAAENLVIESVKTNRQRRTSITRLSADQRQNLKKSVIEEGEVFRRLTSPDHIKNEEQEPVEKVRKVDEKSEENKENEKQNTDLEHISNSNNKADAITDLPTIKPRLHGLLRKADSLPTTDPAETKESPPKTYRSFSNSSVEDTKERWSNKMFGHSQIGLSALRGANAQRYIPESQNFESSRPIEEVRTSQEDGDVKEPEKDNEKAESEDTEKDILRSKTDKTSSDAETIETKENRDSRPCSLFAPASNEAEIVRKIASKTARKTRRSTQGVSREDVQLAEKALEEAAKKKSQNHSLGITSVREENQQKASDEKKAVDTDKKEEIKDESDKKSHSKLSVFNSSSITSDKRDKVDQPTSTTFETISSKSSPKLSYTSQTVSPTTDSSAYRSKSFSSRRQVEPEEKRNLDTDFELRHERRERERQTRRERTQRLEESLKRSEEILNKSRDIDTNFSNNSYRDSTRIRLTPATSSNSTSLFNKDTELYPLDRTGLIASNRRRHSARSADRIAVLEDNNISTPTTSSSIKSNDLQNNVRPLDEEHRKILEENEKLKRDLEKAKADTKRAREETEEAKNELERNRKSTTNYYDASERREKRALERRVSELEEELKQFDHVKIELQKVKEENSALIRVISKLSKGNEQSCDRYCTKL